MQVISYDLSKGKAGQTAMRTSASKPLACNGTSSGSSRAQTFVATFDKHSLFVWRVGEAVHQPLNLHHTKPYTVRGWDKQHGGSEWLGCNADRLLPPCLPLPAVRRNQCR